jgi:hypothetical protein
MNLTRSTARTYRATLGADAAATPAYVNVNDHLYRGKSAEEIARIHAANQGITVAQAMADPSIQLFTDEVYRARVTTPQTPVTLSPVDFNTINQSTGLPEHSTRALDVVAESDARKIAQYFGATMRPEPKLLGQQQQDYTIVFPNGVTMNASDLASRLNNARTPEQVYLLNKDITALVTSTHSQNQAKQAALITSKPYLDAIRANQPALSPVITSTTTPTSAPTPSFTAPPKYPDLPGKQPAGVLDPVFAWIDEVFTGPAVPIASVIGRNQVSGFKAPKQAVTTDTDSGFNAQDLIVYAGVAVAAYYLLFKK